MAKGRPKAPLVLSEAEQAQLSSIARSRSMPAALTERAQLVLRCASGESNHAVAQHLTLTETTVGKWRGRFVRHRLRGLYDELRPGRRSVGLRRQSVVQPEPKRSHRTQRARAHPRGADLHPCSMPKDMLGDVMGMFFPTVTAATFGQESDAVPLPRQIRSMKKVSLCRVLSGPMTCVGRTMVTGRPSRRWRSSSTSSAAILCRA